jgi:TonB family protein
MISLVYSLSILQVLGSDFFVKEFRSIEYPRLALQALISGDVYLRVKVDRDGGIAEVTPISGHKLLTGSAQEQIKAWKFFACGAKDGDEYGELELRFTFTLTSPPSHTPKSVTTYLHSYHITISSSGLLASY